MHNQAQHCKARCWLILCRSVLVSFCTGVKTQQSFIFQSNSRRSITSWHQARSWWYMRIQHSEIHQTNSAGKDALLFTSHFSEKAQHSIIIMTKTDYLSCFLIQDDSVSTSRNTPLEPSSKWSLQTPKTSHNPSILRLRNHKYTDPGHLLRHWQAVFSKMLCKNRWKIKDVLLDVFPC